MKRFIPGFCCLLAGFALARLVPFSGTPGSATDPDHGRASTTAAAAAPVLTKPAPPAKVVPPPSFSLEGDWRPAAEEWAKRNPAEFYRWLVERGIPPEKEVLQVLFQEWARQDADAAFTAAFNLPGDFNRQEALLDGMLATTLKAPGGLRAALKWIPRVQEQISGWTWPGSEWMENGTPQEIAALLKESEMGNDFGYGSSMLDQFAAFWAKKDMPAAMAWLKELGPLRSASAFPGLLKTWAKTDPRAALDYLAGEATSIQRFSVHLPLAELAKTDPKAALDWWENNLGVPDPNSVRLIYGEWVRRGDAEGRDHALAIEDPVLRRHTLGAWGEMAKVESVLQALAEVPGAADRKTLLLSASLRYGEKPSEMEAIRRLVADPGNPDITPEMAANVSGRYAHEDPQAALDWVAALPEALQVKSVPKVIRVWKDKVTAVQAVENLPAGPMKTAAQEALKSK